MNLRGLKRLGLALLVGLPAAGAQTADFEEANRLYEAGDYPEAIAAYQRLASNRTSVAIQFNLANACFKSGQLGEAIAHYLQARTLAPRDPDVLANLRFARAQVRGPTFRDTWLRQRALWLTPVEWAALASAALWLFFGLLTAGQLQPRWRNGLRPWTRAGGMLAAVLVGASMWVLTTVFQTTLGVVTAPDAAMRRGPFEESETSARLQAGAELRILDRREHWYRVNAGKNQEGWIQAGAVRIVTRP